MKGYTGQQAKDTGTTSVCLASLTKRAIHSKLLRCTKGTCSVRLLTREYKKEKHNPRNGIEELQEKHNPRNGIEELQKNTTREIDSSVCLARFTRRATSKSPLLALRLDARSARLVMGV